MQFFICRVVVDACNDLQIFALNWAQYFNRILDMHSSFVVCSLDHVMSFKYLCFELSPIFQWSLRINSSFIERSSFIVINLKCLLRIQHNSSKGLFYAFFVCRVFIEHVINLGSLLWIEHNISIESWLELFICRVFTDQVMKLKYMLRDWAQYFNRI